MSLYVHRNRRLIRDGEPRTSTSTFTQLLTSEPERWQSSVFLLVLAWKRVLELEMTRLNARLCARSDGVVPGVEPICTSSVRQICDSRQTCKQAGTLAYCSAVSVCRGCPSRCDPEGSQRQSVVSLAAVLLMFSFVFVCCCCCCCFQPVSSDLETFEIFAVRKMGTVNGVMPGDL